VQEIIHFIPVKKIKVPKWMTYIKYVMLAVFVMILPVAVTNYMGIGKPAYCQYICPAGTLEGGLPLLSIHSELRQTLGPIFSLKLTILILVVAGCSFVYRFFLSLIHI